MKTVLTMTSWTQRINFVAKSIYTFLTSQSVKPDIFYLWLSVEEFPEKEKSLPSDLLKIVKYFNINLQWIPTNEYCHKRWYVYPKHYNDLVICIDDDQIYPNTLIEDAQKLCNTENSKNIIYNIFYDLTYASIYRGIRFVKHMNAWDNRPSMFKTFNGQSIFPPNTFPLEAITPENILLRKKYCKICDESWLMPFIKYNNTEIGSLNAMYNETNVSDIGRTFVKMSKTVYNTVTVQDMQLYIVLRLFPKLMEKWKSLFPSYITEDFDKCSIDSLVYEMNSWL